MIDILVLKLNLKFLINVLATVLIKFIGAINEMC